jgi:hypothetical protein
MDQVHSPWTMAQRSVHNGPRWRCGHQDCGGSLELVLPGTVGHRRSPRGVEKGDRDIAVSGMPSMETWRQ